MHEMNHQELITQYILELRGQSVCLPFQEYQVIQKWVHLAGHDGGRLFEILQDTLPDFYSNPQKRPPSLKRIDSRVCRLLTSQP